MPAAPNGKSTVLGGEVQNVDPVRDEFRLKVIGQRPITIQFDERTQVYLDGRRIPLRDLRSDSHGSVQTVLDGTNVFALSVHLLSRSQEGEYQGRVLNYNPDTRELTVSAALSREPITLLVPMNTPVVREGWAELSSTPPGPSDLVKGTLIALTFESVSMGRAIAKRIAILATPGSKSMFSGILSSLDMHSGLMMLLDPQDGKEYQVFFDSTRFPKSQTLREGDDVRVTAIFDGSRYVASAIAVD
jgi:hypothetical protein